MHLKLCESQSPGMVALGLLRMPFRFLTTRPIIRMIPSHRPMSEAPVTKRQPGPKLTSMYLPRAPLI